MNDATVDTVFLCNIAVIHPNADPLDRKAPYRDADTRIQCSIENWNGGTVERSIHQCTPVKVSREQLLENRSDYV